jgi:hypothetical protein
MTWPSLGKLILKTLSATGQQRMLTPPWHLTLPSRSRVSVLPYAGLCICSFGIVVTFYKFVTSPIDIVCKQNVIAIFSNVPPTDLCQYHFMLMIYNITELLKIFSKCYVQGGSLPVNPGQHTCDKNKWDAANILISCTASIYQFYSQIHWQIVVELWYADIS